MNEFNELRWWQDDLSERFDALIFDCDGTLTDSMPLHYRAWRDTLLARGVEFPEPRFYSMGGMPTDKIIDILCGEQNVSVDVDATAQAKEDAFEELMGELQPLQIVCDCAARHRGQMPMAVASGGIRPIVERQLKQIEMLDWFGAIVTSEDTELHKPEPDAFLLAARLLDVNPTRCLVFEDSPLGFDAACRAGMQFVDVRPTVAANGK
ncbi:HAD family hydrolase [Rhodopirellula sp. SWK7]|uniref:HAD family hydrolase n=1 Tax=Rhodopirellula sp. SWK7 TaxID=595460 RepID=UPI0002BEC48A|nr:HAD family phosphatase [Rhodopirellula sp. SWK7]EMI42412.1 HAD-superfamily hydrolase, subfamily IA, variant 3 [Rhodopirellula sp. SWK7]